MTYKCVNDLLACALPMEGPTRSESPPDLSSQENSIWDTTDTHSMSEASFSSMSDHDPPPSSHLMKGLYTPKDIGSQWAPPSFDSSNLFNPGYFETCPEYWVIGTGTND